MERLTKLYKERYKGFNVRHFHEFAIREHGITRGYTWTRGVLARAGLVAPSGRGGPHRLRRERKPMHGLMIHQDGSNHQRKKGTIPFLSCRSLSGFHFISTQTTGSVTFFPVKWIAPAKSPPEAAQIRWR